MWLTGPAAPRHVGSSRTRARTRVPRTGRRTPNRCAAGEAPPLFIHFYSHPLLSRNHPPFPSLSVCKRLAHSTKHLECFSHNLGYMLIIQLFSLQGITHLCQLVLFCSMNSRNYTSSLSTYYPKQSKSKKSCLLTAVVCYGCYNKLPQIERLKQHK